MNWRRTLALGLACCVLLGGCGKTGAEAQGKLKKDEERDRHEMTTFAMDTVMQFTIYSKDGEKILTDAEQEIRRLEGLLSVTMENSDIARLNASAGKEAVSVAEDTMDLLQRGKRLGEETDGCFDITISPIVKAWGFTEAEKHVPPAEELEGLLPLTREEDLLLEGNTAFLKKEGMAVDLGGIAKGYASDRVTELLRQEGVSSAVFSLGGNVGAIGKKPNGQKWEVALGNPLDTNDYVGLLQVSDCTVITSGGYQRYFEENGKRYHHIIDPATGYPAESGLLSVTIIGENGTRGDALSTSLFIMGLDKALDFWRSHNDFEAIFITEAGEVIATEGIAPDFAFEGRDNDFTFRVENREK